MTRKIILASVSPRRKELMKLLLVPFVAVDPGYEEVMHKHLTHEELVKFLALGKANAAAKKYPEGIIIAADTIVSFKGKAVGKPKNKKEAFLMLKSFKTKPQTVVTGMVVLDAKTKKIFSTVEKSKIVFKKVPDKDILDYINSGESLDKAGGYGPIGRGLNIIAKVEGDYTTALGLSMNFVANALVKLGVKF